MSNKNRTQARTVDNVQLPASSSESNEVQQLETTEGDAPKALTPEEELALVKQQLEEERAARQETEKALEATAVELSTAKRVIVAPNEADLAKLVGPREARNILSSESFLAQSASLQSQASSFVPPVRTLKDIRKLGDCRCKVINRSNLGKEPYAINWPLPSELKSKLDADQVEIWFYGGVAEVPEVVARFYKEEMPQTGKYVVTGL